MKNVLERQRSGRWQGYIAGFQLQHFKRPFDQLGFVKVDFVVGPGNFGHMANQCLAPLQRQGGVR